MRHGGSEAKHDKRSSSLAPHAHMHAHIRTSKHLPTHPQNRSHAHAHTQMTQEDVDAKLKGRDTINATNPRTF